jgi:hypothetical protein
MYCVVVFFCFQHRCAICGWYTQKHTYALELNDKLFRRTTIKGFIAPQYNIAVYANHHIYLMMDLCGRNMS